MRAMLLVRDPQVRDMVSFAFHSEPNTEVFAFGAVHKAMDQMLDGQEFDLIVLELTEQSSKLIKFLVSLASNTPIVFLKSDPNFKKDSEFSRLNILGEVDLESAVTGLKLILAKSKLGTSLEVSDPSVFLRIQTTLLTRLVPLEADIFIRLSPTKFLRIFQKGDVFNEQDLERYYLRKQLEFFYFRKTDAQAFLSKLDEFVSGVLKRGVDDGDVPGLFAEVADLFFNLTESLPVSPQLIHFVESSVGTVIEGVRNKPLLADLLKNLDLSKGSYRAVHSSLLAHMTGLLAVKLNWESNSTLQKLSYAALFHDLALDTDDEARIEDLSDCKDLVEEAFSVESITKKIREHPLVIGEYLKQFPDISPEVSQIIAQHHERPDGSGFPKGLIHSQMAPLGALFQVAHEVVHRHMLTYQSIPEIVDALPAQYKQGVYKRIIQALKSA